MTLFEKKNLFGVTFLYGKYVEQLFSIGKVSVTTILYNKGIIEDAALKKTALV